MIPKILDAIHIKEFIIHLKFEDGAEGDVDLKDELDGPIFRPLKKPSYFKKFTLHPELRTVTWPNGADFAPEFLYEKTQVSALRDFNIRKTTPAQPKRHPTTI